MKSLKFLITILFVTEAAFSQEAIFAASDSVLLIAENLHSKIITAEQAVTQVHELEQRQKLSTTDLSVIKQYIDPNFALASQRLEKMQEDHRLTTDRLDDFRNLSSSRLELSKNQKTFLMVGLGIAAGVLILDSQGKKIEFTW